MIFELFGSALMYFAVSFGLAWPLAARLALDPAEKLAASVAISLLGVFVIAWTVYVCAASTAVLWVIPALTAAALAIGRRTLAEALQDSGVQRLLIAQAIVTSWCIGWLALVMNYSGGKQVADWFGHWQRALFFLHHWPRDLLFNGFDPLPSRPPLANVVTGAFLRVTRIDFAHYQLASTVLSSLAFLPAALLARRFRPAQAVGEPPRRRSATNILAILFMVSPMFVQNATYAWTKLPAAFFTLTAIYFFLRTRDPDAPLGVSALFGATLGAALLTHYSAGPYAVLFAVAWIASARRGLQSRAWWTATVTAVVSGTCVLLIWFGWAITVYGTRGTFLSNTSVTDQAPTAGEQLMVVALNLRDTIVPHFLRTSDFNEFAQRSPWGRWRDCFFLLYQCNLWFVFGSIVGAAICARLWITQRNAPKATVVFWGSFVAGVVVLGVATHGGRESSGLAHISLQPLVLLGLAFLAAQWPSLSQLWRRALVAGATIDFSLGIALQFGTENHAFDRWFAPGRPFAEVFSSYSLFAQLNSRVKIDAKWVFVGDLFGGVCSLVVALLASLLLLALMRARRIAPSAK